MFASGKHAWAICDRCGFRFKYLDIVEEEGTRWRVCQSCDDGEYSMISHPQNGPFLVDVDPEGLEFARPDVSVTAALSTWP